MKNDDMKTIDLFIQYIRSEDKRSFEEWRKEIETRKKEKDNEMDQGY